jgi:hypothetical protein
MITKEKVNKNPFDSDYEERLLFDKLILTPKKTEPRYTKPVSVLTCGHEESHFNNIYKVLSSTSHEKSKKIEEKIMIKLELRGELFRVC